MSLMQCVNYYVKKNSNQALLIQMGKQGGGLKANDMISKSTANGLDNFNSKKKQSLVAKKIALLISEKCSCVIFDFATVVEIIQHIITCKGLREFSIQCHDQNSKKLNTIKISIIQNFKQTAMNAPDKT